MTGPLVAGLTLLVIILLGWTWRRGAKVRAEMAAKYPPPGKLVDVGGYRLHINCQGTAVAGRPTVVIEAGNGEFSLNWSLIQREVARFTRICTYDRAGLGWSDRSPQPRTAHDIVVGLHTLLARAGVGPPYVLVGHSVGGLFVRLYAHEYPEQVVGVILVDAAHEDMLLRYPAAARRLEPRATKLMAGVLRVMQIATAAGLFALFPQRTAPRQILGTLPEEARETYLGLMAADAKGLQAIREELVAARDHLASGRAARITALGDIPLIVLSRGLSESMPGLSAKDNQETEQTWQQMQVELAEQSTRGKRIVADKSGHHIHIQQPDLMIDAIRQVVEAARRPSAETTKSATLASR